METIDERTLKEKIEAGWLKTTNAVRSGVDWCVKNKEITVVVFPTVCVTICKVADIVTRSYHL